MANRYWVGGSGTWNSSNTANWSTSSGGSGGASVPSQSDTVYFDNNSGGGTVTIGSTVYAEALFIYHPSMTIGGPSNVYIYQACTISSSGGTFTNLSLYFFVNDIAGNFQTNKQIGSISSSFGAGTTFNFNTDVTATSSISINTSVNGIVGRPANIYLNGYTFRSNSSNIFVSAAAYSNGTANIFCSGAAFTASSGAVGISTSGSIGGGVTGIGTTQGNSLELRCYTGSGQITTNNTSVNLYGFNAVTVTNDGTGSMSIGNLWNELSGTVGITKNSSGSVSVNNVYYKNTLNNGSGCSVTRARPIGTGNKTTTNNGTISTADLDGSAGSSASEHTISGSGTIGSLIVGSPTTSLRLDSNITTTSLTISGSSPGSLSVIGNSVQRTLTASNFTLSNISWQRINAAGTIPFTGTGFVDLGSNDNIQFTVPGSSLFFGSNF